MSALYDIEVTKIDGQDTTLSEYNGKVMLIVNVASKCGLTPQYEQLESLYESNKDKGLVVLGFPSNEFAGQEPGSEDEIQDFCRSTYGVQFPMFSKICVNGADRHSLYKTLISAQPARKEVENSALLAKLKEVGLLSDGPTSDVLWNFEKFLVSKKGEIVGRFAPDITVNDPVLADAIKQELQA